MLQFQDVTKSFGEGERRHAVIDGVSFDVAAGEYVALTGESGIGKSTVLNLIAGLEVPDHGRILLDGENLVALDDRARTLLRRRRMGFVFQAFHLLPHLTLGGNVGLPLALNGTPSRQARERVREVLAAVGLAERTDSYPRELSGGEMQRVAIARALVHRPALVLADEPTGNLDPHSAAQVLELMRTQVKRDRAAAILVTHSELAAATADRTLRMTGRGLVAG